jgi:uncharacterized metal-binding protein
VILARPRPVLFACRGCERGRLAADVAVALDRRGLAEASLAGFDEEKARARFPIYAIEGCRQACACRWLCSLGVSVQRCFFTDASTDPAAEIERIAREWRA